MGFAGKPHVHRVVSRPFAAFDDRQAAGTFLAEWINPARDPDALVLALPRGGVPVGHALAIALGCELKPVLVRKLPLPSSPEMGFGAVAVDGTLVLNDDVVDAFELDGATIAQIAAFTRAEVERRAREYPGGWPLPALQKRRVWLVDDGLATGFSAIAATRMIRANGAISISLAVPCAPASSLQRLEPEVDELWCVLAQTVGSFAVASYYRDFHDLSDAEVVGLLG